MLNLFKIKPKSDLEFLKKEFEFLTLDFKYEMIKEVNSNIYKGGNLVIYKSSNSKKQIEISGNHNFYNIIIRKLIENKVSEYKNKQNNINFENLALLENVEYDSFDYLPYGNTDFKGVVKNTKQLFIRNKSFFTTEKWINFDQLKDYKNKNHKKKFGYNIPEKTESYISKIKRIINSNFPELTLIFDNQTLPHYHNESTLEKVIYKNGELTIKIEQYCWRDYREIFTFFINEVKFKEIDISKFKSDEKILTETKRIIKAVCNKV